MPFFFAPWISSLATPLLRTKQTMFRLPCLPWTTAECHRRLIFQYDVSLPKSTSHYIIFHIRCSVSRHENYLFNRFFLCLGTLDHNSQLKRVCDRPVPFRCFKLRSLTHTIKVLICIGNMPDVYFVWYTENTLVFSQSLQQHLKLT
jgi:hypothetical protein